MFTSIQGFVSKESRGKRLENNFARLFGYPYRIPAKVIPPAAFLHPQVIQSCLRMTDGVFVVGIHSRPPSPLYFWHVFDEALERRACVAVKKVKIWGRECYSNTFGLSATSPRPSLLFKLCRALWIRYYYRVHNGTVGQVHYPTALLN